MIDLILSYSVFTTIAIAMIMAVAIVVDWIASKLWYTRQNIYSKMRKREKKITTCMTTNFFCTGSLITPWIFATLKNWVDLVRLRTTTEAISL